MWKLTMTLAGLALAAPALAATPIDERRPLAADGRLSVNNLAGRIEVVGWDRPEVAISGELGDDVEALEIDGDGRQLSVHVRYPRRRGSIEETLLRLQVPRTVALELEAVSADIAVTGTAGPSLRASSVSGDVGAKVGGGQLVLNTVSGDIELDAAAERAELQSVSGDVVARGLRGRVRAETVSGELMLSGGPFGELTAESVSGDIVLEGPLAAAGTLRAESLSGEIRVRLGQVPDARISLQTFSGSLHSEFGGGPGERRKLEHSSGAGAGRIELNSFSGDIRLLR